jgi:NTE family protein
VFCATNLQTGVLFRFTDAYAGDYVVGKIERPNLLLAQAVAASSAFPPVLSPLKLKFPDGTFKDWGKPAGTDVMPKDLLRKLRREVILSDGGVYDNHGLEPIVKRYMTLLVSDGGAPFGRDADIGFDWVRQLKRILDVTDNQVRGLRRRNLIDRLRLGQAAFDANTLKIDEVRVTERLGAYWGIDTDASKVAPPNALMCDDALTNEIAQASTRLSDMGERRAKQIINWGYAISDRCIRTHCRGVDFSQARKPTWPFLEAKL